MSVHFYSTEQTLLSGVCRQSTVSRLESGIFKLKRAVESARLVSAGEIESNSVDSLDEIGSVTLGSRSALFWFLIWDTEMRPPFYFWKLLTEC